VDALTFELGVVRHIQLSIAGAGGDDDYTGRDRLTVVEPDPVELFGAVDTSDIARDRKPRSKLLRLDLRAPGQRLAGDPGREAEIVLDLRRGASLAAGRCTLDHDRVQPFRSAVDGRRQSRRASSDHGNVIDMVGIDGLGQPQVVGERRGRRIAQHPMVRRDHDRELVGCELKAVEEPARVRIDLGVE
jgi:hypothetical protein